MTFMKWKPHMVAGGTVNQPSGIWYEAPGALQVLAITPPQIT